MPNVVSAVDRILAGHGMRGQGKWFVYYARKHNVDLGLLVGIAGAETTWGDAGTGVRGQYNPFGFMRNGPGTGLTFSSYKVAIAKMASLMRTGYRKYSRPGHADPAGMMHKYVGYSSGDWLATASKYANTLGAGKGGKPPKGGKYAAPRAAWVFPTAKRGSDLGGVSAHQARALGNWQSDNAWDIGVPIGTPIIAVHSGKIGRIDTRPLDGGQFSGGSIYLKTAGNQFWYKHLKKVIVKEGQYVKAGQVIGYSGEGNGVPHLHFASMKGDPQRLFENRPLYTEGGAAIPSAPGAEKPIDIPTTPQAKEATPGYAPAQDIPDLIQLPGTATPIFQPKAGWEAWGDLAALPGASPETQAFAYRSRLFRGG